MNADEGQGQGGESGGAAEREPWRLWDHIGVISGVTLGALAVGFLLFVSLAGDPAAFAIVVTVVIGIALIVAGSALHGARGR